MGFLMGVLDHVKQAVTSPFESKSQPQAQASGVNALDSSSTGSTGSTTDSSTNEATITANDFLTLLVTEIQNQDPTTQTDPMQYITQLVGVNSLEQLVQINQTLTTATGGTTTTGSAASSPSPAAATSATAKSAATSTSGASATASHLLPLGSHTQLPAAADTAVASAFTQASTLPTQAQAPTQVPLSPEVMRALQHSIPGATFTGSSSLPAINQTGTGSAVR
ncbi:MAG: flagellar hook capping FlgD N-terminal domain-containing protein [Acidobacteriaceae bacterium]